MAALARRFTNVLPTHLMCCVFILVSLRQTLFAEAKKQGLYADIQKTDGDEPTYRVVFTRGDQEVGQGDTITHYDSRKAYGRAVQSAMRFLETYK